jgi:hypothetical protein
MCRRCGRLSSGRWLSNLTPQTQRMIELGSSDGSSPPRSRAAVISAPGHDGIRRRLLRGFPAACELWGKHKISSHGSCGAARLIGARDPTSSAPQVGPAHGGTVSGAFVFDAHHFAMVAIASCLRPNCLSEVRRHRERRSRPMTPGWQPRAPWPKEDFPLRACR